MKSVIIKDENESLCLFNYNVDSKKLKTYNSQTYIPKLEHDCDHKSKCELYGDRVSKDGKTLYIKHFHRDLGKVDLNGVYGITKCYRLAYHAVSQENSRVNIKEKEENVHTDIENNLETDAVDKNMYSANLTTNVINGEITEVSVTNTEGNKIPELYRKKTTLRKGKIDNESENVCLTEGNTERSEKPKMLKSKRKSIGEKKKNEFTINNEGLGPMTFSSKIKPTENVEKEAPQLLNEIDNNKESNNNDKDTFALPKKPTLKFKKIDFDNTNNNKDPKDIEKSNNFYNIDKVKLKQLKSKVNPSNNNKDTKDPFFSPQINNKESSNPLFSFINSADTKSYKNLLERIKSSKANKQTSSNMDNDDFYNPNKKETKPSNQRSSIFDSIKPYSIAINEYKSSENFFSPSAKMYSTENVEINGVKAPKSIKELKDKFYTLDSNRKTSLRDISGMIKVEESKSIWGEQDLSSRSQLKCYPINYKPFNWYIVDSMIYPPNNMHETALKIDNQKLFK